VKTKITTRSALIFAFLALLSSALGFFWADMEVLNDEITVILPYIIIMIVAVWFIGEKSGAFFAFLSACLWLISKTDGFKRINENILLDLAVKMVFIGAQYLFIVQLKRMHERVKDSAIVDELTELHNRRGFHYLAQYEFARQIRDSSCLTMVSLDIDGFKAENDSKGHKEGDAILEEMGRILKSCVRGSDIAARMGGDEFSVLMGDADLQEGLRIATRIRERFRASCEARSWGTTLSIGVFSSVGASTIDEMIIKADELMYKGKRAGKDRIEAGNDCKERLGADRKT
jgi:diguanylate cyclase (GGDEF)-like protein